MSNAKHQRDTLLICEFYSWIINGEKKICIGPHTKTNDKIWLWRFILFGDCDNGYMKVAHVATQWTTTIATHTHTALEEGEREK